MHLEFQGSGRNTGLRSSLHYASTPTLNSTGNSSVDESGSTGSSSDYWDNNSAASSNGNNDDYNVYSPNRIFIQNPNRGKSTRRRPRQRVESPETQRKFEPAQHLRTSSVRFGSQVRIPIQSSSPNSSGYETESRASDQSTSSNSGKFEAEVRVTPQDLSAVDACLRGHRTRVFVCHSMANLYTCPRASTATPSTATSLAWTLAYTGIPALILDPGNTKSRTKRQIQLVLVEKGTGFILWSDVVDNLTKYTRQSGPFHTMHLSSDHSSRIGLSFDDSEAADNFYQHLLRLTSDPANIALSGPRASSKKSTGSHTSPAEAEAKSRRKYRPPNKSEISQPCAFQHVVSISQKDYSKYFSLQAYVRGKVEIIQKSSSLSHSNISNVNNSNNNGSSSGANYKRATSIRSFPKQPPPPPPAPKRNTSLSCHDLTSA